MLSGSDYISTKNSDCVKILKETGVGGSIRVFEAMIPGVKDLLQLKTSSFDCVFLKQENVLLQTLKASNLLGKGFPKLVEYQIDSLLDCSNVLTTHPGPSLQSLILSQPSAMNQASALNIGMQLVNRIESLHSTGFYHGNICPSSIYFSGKDRK